MVKIFLLWYREQLITDFNRKSANEMSRKTKSAIQDGVARLIQYKSIKSTINIKKILVMTARMLLFVYFLIDIKTVYFLRFIDKVLKIHMSSIY